MQKQLIMNNLKNIKFSKKLVVLIIVILVIIFLSHIYKSKININTNDKTINLDKKEIIFNTNIQEIKNRNTYVKNTNEIYIGNTKKEIENGFYDIYITNKNNTINIYINKLFKEFKYDILYNEEYLDEILNYINNISNFEIDIFNLKKDIIKYYLDIKNIHEKTIKTKEYKLDKYKFIFQEENNILKIDVKEV